jgi:hypothetical protein
VQHCPNRPTACLSTDSLHISRRRRRTSAIHLSNGWVLPGVETFVRDAESNVLAGTIVVGASVLYDGGGAFVAAGRRRTHVQADD